VNILRQTPIELLDDGVSALCLNDEDSFESMVEKMMLMHPEERADTFHMAHQILEALEVAEYQLQGATLH
jgi:ABC-type thiamine transport system ATPase subunit